MGKHRDRIICPVCHKKMRDAQALKTHQKVKKHHVQTARVVADRDARIRLQQLHEDHVAQGKGANHE